ncbi:hypothetical protein DL240_19125 [Lujinxingia litoralis]|uniref:Uncharacterized protein n=1 Tax=Lujinxingia litoralis TaxID=2211119 RepID=A0A328C4S2_9DELT|nr:hypothetical protein [Lujinxingia litoralis]RAL20020.1 hypothetical protein DL240_19125 [Lujinxingia litoralis]
MTYEEFEWHILRLVYEEGMDRLQPSYLAYALGLPHERVTAFLDQATQAGLVELEVKSDGRLEYAIPGIDHSRSLPRPIWRDQEQPAPTDATALSDEARRAAAAEAARDLLAHDPAAGTPAPLPGAPPEPRPSEPGAVHQAAHTPHHRLAVARHPLLPASLRAHIEERYGHSDARLVPVAETGLQHDQLPVVDPTRRAMVAVDNDEHFPFRIEASDDTFCDPSQTVFMRQMRAYGVKDEQELRYHVQRLFESFGYRVVQSEHERLRFERGSLTFIIAMVPLFVLVLPLFVYLFLYCMGRSTIHQEPVELDVQFRKRVENGEPVFDIDLTFVGLHGVVLGAADQRVLNQEIDTLRDELRWSLSAG